MKNGSDIQPGDSFLTLPVFLSSINQLKVPQWSSVWQWRGIYHSQIKGSVLLNVRFYPRPGIYGNWRHCVCGPPGYTAECEAPRNETIESAAFHFHPEDVIETVQNTTETQLVSRRGAPVHPAPRFHRRVGLFEHNRRRKQRRVKGQQGLDGGLKKS